MSVVSKYHLLSLVQPSSYSLIQPELNIIVSCRAALPCTGIHMAQTGTNVFFTKKYELKYMSNLNSTFSYI